MDPMQKWLDELTIIHLGCIIEYGPNGRLIFIDVPNEEEEKSSLESDSTEFRNQNSFTSSTVFPDNTSDEETNPAAAFSAHKESEMKTIVSVDNENKEKQKKKNKKKGKKIEKNKFVPLNDKIPGSDKVQSTFDQLLQILDELVSKLPEPDRSNQYIKKPGDLMVQLVRRKHSKRMKLQRGYLSPVPEEIPAKCVESAAKGEKDALTSLQNSKEQGTTRQHTEKNKPLSGKKIQWSKLKLPSLTGKKKNQQKVKTHEEHVREEARNTTPSIFTRFPLKRNKVKPMDVNSSQLPNLAMLPSVVTKVSVGTTTNSLFPVRWMKLNAKKAKKTPHDPRFHSTREQRSNINTERLVNPNTRVKELKKMPRYNVHDSATRISSNSRKTERLPQIFKPSLNTCHLPH